MKSNHQIILRRYRAQFFATLLVFLSLLSGCHQRGEMGFAGLYKYEYNGIDFQLPNNGKGKMEVRSDGFSWKNGTFQIEFRGDTLFVGAKNYGKVASGDRVEIIGADSVKINGNRRIPN